MSLKKKLIADLLFGIQIIGAVGICASQFLRFLKTTQGQLLSMFLLMEGYLFLHFLLATKAHKAQPSRTTRQTLLTYVIWLAFIGSNILAIFLNGNYRWSRNDTITSILALSGATIVLIGAKIRRIESQDPMIKSLLAMLCKALPQFMMAIRIAQVGGAGLPVVAIISGHITILTRIIQIWLTIREAGWERNRAWLCISEIMNEISWITVLIVWLFWALS